jgi:hypothetical protein
MIHRLMKNHVTENVGWAAYMLFTDRAIQSLGVQVEGIHNQIESYEHLGEIQIYCIDLHARYKEIIETKRIFVSPEEADLTFTFDFEAPPPVIWHWMTDIEKKNRLAGDEAIFSVIARPGGRSGPGASNHCAHGKDLKGSLTEKILDWRPFDYFTIETVDGKMIMHLTNQFEPLSNGSRTHFIIHCLLLSPRLPRIIRRPILKPIFTKINLSNCQKIAKLIAQETDAEVGTRAVQAAA